MATQIRANQVYNSYFITSFSQENAVRQSDGGWKVSKKPKFARVYLNGLAMSPGIDYSLVDDIITFVPEQPTAPSDTVLVEIVS